MAKKCCKQCGRDTTATYCSGCSPYGRGNTRQDEQKIRKRDKIITHDDDLIRDEESDTLYTPGPKVDPYNGSTTRDDI